MEKLLKWVDETTFAMARLEAKVRHLQDRLDRIEPLHDKDQNHWIPGWPKAEPNKLYLFAWSRGYTPELKIAVYDTWYKNWIGYESDKNDPTLRSKQLTTKATLIFEKPHYHLFFDLPIFREEDRDQEKDIKPTLAKPTLDKTNKKGP